MNVIIPRMHSLSGSVEVPPSKSYTHRALVASLLSSGKSSISKPLISDDTRATLAAVEALGAKVREYEGLWEVEGCSRLVPSNHPILCGESGATLRFMAPVAALAPSTTILVAGPTLRRRPIRPLLSALEQLGSHCKLNPDAGAISIAGGGLRGGLAVLPGDVSSQFVTGLLMAAPLADRDVEIELTSPLESRSYVKATLEILEKHCIDVEAREDFRRFAITAGQQYRPHPHAVPGDFSSASYFIAASLVTRSTVKIRGLETSFTQADAKILEIVESMGASTSRADGDLLVSCGEVLAGREIVVRDCPDLAPILAVLGCYAAGRTDITNAKRLRYKESDRLRSIYAELKKMGAEIEMGEDHLIVNGSSRLRGAPVDSHEDHRIAMSLSIAALGAEGRTIIKGADCVSKSYPDFFQDLSRLGVKIIGG